MEPRTLTAEDITAGVERLAAAIREKYQGNPDRLRRHPQPGDEAAERVLTLLPRMIASCPSACSTSRFTVTTSSTSTRTLHCRKATSVSKSMAPTSSCGRRAFHRPHHPRRARRPVRLRPPGKGRARRADRSWPPRNARPAGLRRHHARHPPPRSCIGIAGRDGRSGSGEDRRKADR